MRHFVDDDVLKLERMLLGEFQVEPDVPRLAVAGAPLGLHAPDAPARNWAANPRLPLGDELRNRLTQLGSLPGAQQLEPGVRVEAGRKVQHQPIAVELDMRPARTLDDLQSVAHAPDVV